MTYVEEKLTRHRHYVRSLWAGVRKIQTSIVIRHRLLVEDFSPELLETGHVARDEVLELDEPLSTREHLLHEEHGGVIEGGHVELPNMDEYVVEIPLAPHMLQQLAVQYLSNLDVDMGRHVELRDRLWLVDKVPQLTLKLVGGIRLILLFHFWCKRIGVVDSVGNRCFWFSTTLEGLIHLLHLFNIIARRLNAYHLYSFYQRIVRSNYRWCDSQIHSN